MSQNERERFIEQVKMVHGVDAGGWLWQKVFEGRKMYSYRELGFYFTVSWDELKQIASSIK